MGATRGALREGRRGDGASARVATGSSAVAPPAYGIGFVDRGEIDRGALQPGELASPSGAPWHVVQAVQAPGRSLPAAVSGSRGLAGAGVQIHDDEAAARSAAQFDADAYAFGPHIVFGRDRYRPGSGAGRSLLLHELAHVAQRPDPVDLRRPLTFTRDDGPDERAADAFSRGGPAPRRVADGGTAVVACRRRHKRRADEEETDGEEAGDAGDSGDTVGRRTALDVAPAHRGSTKDVRNYTIYTPKDRRRLRADVVAALGSGSVAARVARVITKDGGSKTFEELKGLDGLTFGLTDFATSGGVVDFFRAFRREFPADYALLFPEIADNLVDSRWVKQHNAGEGKGPDADDAGLITDVRVRTGLARLLADPKYRQFQINRFASGKIESSQRLLKNPNKKQRGRGAESYEVQRQFSLAALASVGNSAGPGVAVAWFRQGLAEAGAVKGVARENIAVVYMLRRYVQTANKKRELDKYPDGEAFLDAAIVDPNAALANHKWRLGHRGGRVRKLFEVFPFFAFDPTPSDITQDDIEKPPAPLELVVPPASEIPDHEPPPATG